MIQRHRHPLRSIVPLAGGLAATAVGLAAYTTYVVNAPTRRTALDDFTISPFEVQVPSESVSFTADDGVTIRGWWFPRPDTNHVIVGCTGHRGSKHELIGIGSGLWRAGNNVLLFDFRGCGESEIAPQSLAYHELPDARAAIGFAASRIPDATIGMIGYSMGAAITILIAATDPWVQAVVADSSFATMRDVIAHAYRRSHVPVRPMLDIADLLNRWRYGYPFAAVRPVDAVGHIAPRPLLIIHGQDDAIVPIEQAHLLYEAAREPKEVWIVPGTGHCGAYFVDRAVYVSRVARFFAAALEDTDVGRDAQLAAGPQTNMGVV